MSKEKGINSLMEQGMIRVPAINKGEYWELKNVPSDWIHLINPEVYIHRASDGNLDYSKGFLSEMIHYLPKLKLSGELSERLLSVLESLLLALDRLIFPSEKEEQASESLKDELDSIFSEFLRVEKVHVFLDTRKRITHIKKTIVADGESNAMQIKRDPTVDGEIELVTLLKAEMTSKEHIEQLGYAWMNHYNDYTKESERDMTVVYINHLMRWFFDSASWRAGVLSPFDELSIFIKLGTVHRA